MTNEDKEVIRNCYVMKTDHPLDKENQRLKAVLETVLEENMTSEEKSRWAYDYYLENHKYNSNIRHNITLLKDWAEHLKGMGNMNYPYVYAIERVLQELENKDVEIEKLNAIIDKEM